MSEERMEGKKQLEQELAGLHFASEDAVIGRSHPVTRKERLLALWNKELELPAVPVAIAGLLVAAFLFIPFTSGSTSSVTPEKLAAERQWVQVAGNIYWQDVYERMVNRYAHPDQG
ncbi:hypothetical protein [Gorillibacterium massiliense]|uniref:hypothetical protein n=1 Tax=Gorillibacterium massiliense TaxID=1280390 RepID=UPI0004AE8423|nr:hypothetical protein [Gorillibacterium massiliense]